MSIIIEGLNMQLVNTILWLFAITLKLGLACFVVYLILLGIMAVTD